MLNCDGIVQVFLGENGVHDIEGNELPRLVYVSCEKRAGYHHHKKGGPMNALVECPSNYKIENFFSFLLSPSSDHFCNALLIDCEGESIGLNVMDLRHVTVGLNGGVVCVVDLRRKRLKQSQV